VALAQTFAADHKAIDKLQMDILRETFSDAGIVELVAFISFNAGRRLRGLGIQPPGIKRRYHAA